MHGALRERENARLADFFGGEGAASLAACSRAAGVISVLLTVYPLKQGIEQEVTSKNAKRQKHRKRHRDLTRTGVNAKPELGKNRSGKARKS
jgi:16S rRNA G966 N2-methylase RsmD